MKRERRQPPSWDRQRLFGGARPLLYTLGAVFVVIFTIWMREPVTRARPVFQNEDVAGITYNADLLLHGKVPLLDDLEYKAPGPFFLTAGVFELFGRSIPVLEHFGVLWSAFAALGMLFGGVMLFGLWPGLVAALIYATYAPVLDSMTVNYNSWMITPYIWSVALLAAGLRRGRWGWFFAAGITATLAALLKRQGAVVVPVLGLVTLLLPQLERPGGPGQKPLRRWRPVFSYSGGVLLGFVPLVTYYLVHGGLTVFFEHYFMSSAGWEYLRGQEVSWSGKLDRFEDGLYGLWEYLALPMLLVAMAATSIPLRRRWRVSASGLLLGLLFVFSFIGVSLGFRFYKGYYLQLLPAAAWLAAHPRGPLLRWFDRSLWPRAGAAWGRVGWGVATLLICVHALVFDIPDMKKEQKGRPHAARYQKEALRIGRFIRKNSEPHDRVWVWGRWAWPVYFYADRSSIYYYKVLGVITSNYTNTWKRPTAMTRFVRKGPWREIGAQLAAASPAFIVTANNETYAGFEPLERLLRDRYQRVSGLRLTAFVVYRRDDHPLRAGGAASQPAAGARGLAPRPLEPPPVAGLEDGWGPRAEPHGPLLELVPPKPRRHPKPGLLQPLKRPDPDAAEGGRLRPAPEPRRRR